MTSDEKITEDISVKRYSLCFFVGKNGQIPCLVPPLLTKIHPGEGYT